MATVLLEVRPANLRKIVQSVILARNISFGLEISGENGRRGLVYSPPHDNLSFPKIDKGYWVYRKV